MNEHESEDNYIARVLAMSPEELRAHATAEGIEPHARFDLPIRLRNLRLRLEAALAYHAEQGNREEMAWLGEGVIALGAVLAHPALAGDAVGRDGEAGSVHEHAAALAATPQTPPNPTSGEKAETGGGR